MTKKGQYQIKNPYYLDLQTGFVKAGTEVIETDDLYKNRFIPWSAPIPKSGRVDLAAWQQQMSKSAGQSADDIAKFEEFNAWKAEKEASDSKKPNGIIDVKPIATGMEASAGDSTVGIGAPDDRQRDIEAGVGDPVALTVGQRMDKIMAVIPTLTDEGFTKSANPIPSVKALSEKCDFDVEGHERDQVWENFQKVNPDWKPKSG